MTAALALTDVVVRAVVGADAPQLAHGPRDLPNIARFLFDALGAGSDREVKVLDRVTVSVDAGAAVALVGEAGAGKSMLARVCARLVPPRSGAVELLGVDVFRPKSRALDVRRGLQVLLDDPESGLDPRRTVLEHLRDAHEALRLDEPFGDAVERVRAQAQLSTAVVDARAGTLGAGERRRAAIGRALLAAPAVLVVDEPADLSEGGLDPSERALVLDVLRQLSSSTALLVLTHDLAAARALGKRVGVMQRGRIVELDDGERVFTSPQHPYAQALMAAAPRARR